MDFLFSSRIFAQKHAKNTLKQKERDGSQSLEKERGDHGAHNDISFLCLDPYFTLRCRDFTSEFFFVFSRVNLISCFRETNHRDPDCGLYREHDQFLRNSGKLDLQFFLFFAFRRKMKTQNAVQLNEISESGATDRGRQLPFAPSIRVQRFGCSELFS